MTISARSNQLVLLACLLIPFLAAAEVRPHTSGAVAENSEVYSLTVSGIQLPVERIREGHHAQFAFSSPVEVLVRIPDPVASCSVSPATHQIQTAKGDREGRFVLDNPCKLMLKINNLPPPSFLTISPFAQTPSMVKSYPVSRPNRSQDLVQDWPPCPLPPEPERYDPRINQLIRHKPK